jgi:hypothetical protein
MPIIEPPPTAPKKETVAIRLDISLLDELRRYAAYVGTRNFSHIVACSLERVFKADAGYKAWLKAHPDFRPEPKARRNGTTASEDDAGRSVLPSSAIGLPGARQVASRSSTGGA